MKYGGKPKTGPVKIQYRGWANGPEYVTLGVTKATSPMRALDTMLGRFHVAAKDLPPGQYILEMVCAVSPEKIATRQITLVVEEG